MLDFLYTVCLYIICGLIFTIIVEYCIIKSKTQTMKQITLNNINKLKSEDDKRIAKTRINRIVFKTYILMIFIWPFAVYMLLKFNINNTKKKFK